MISWVSRSARNKLSDVHRLESTADLLPALDRLHEFIQLMQGDNIKNVLLLFRNKLLLLIN